ncbi:MAG: hypothetical protein IH621_18740 [Krumholzibacteria bacterium]|nr:hypothetical protein [Candidatus Krumholzibacteria bacterium]
MKKLALVIIFSLMAGSAFGQYWSSNNIGVYLDPAGEENCGYGTGEVACYLVGTGIETPTVGGFELKLEVEGPAFGPLSVAYPVDALNMASRVNEWFVGYGQPAPVSNGTVVFMSFSLFVQDALTPTDLFISPTYFPSIPGSCAYLDGADYNIILPLVNSTGDPVTGDNVPVFSLNGGCAVPTEDASWGEVKSLFR